MIGGFNSEIEHNGTVFHVQTEDSGHANPHSYTDLHGRANLHVDPDPHAYAHIGP